MQFNQQGEQYNKSINLIGKFLHFDINPYDFLNEQQYSTVLEAMLGHPFDYNVLPQILEQCELNEKKEAKVQDFVQVLLTAELKLLEKINVSQGALQQYQGQQQDIEYQLNNMQQVPQNQFGLDVNSKVTIEVIEAYNLYQTQQDPNEIPYVQIRCGDTQFRTTSNVNIINNQGRLYQWNEGHDFPIQLGTEDIYIEVLSFNSVTNQNFLIGKCFLPLQDFQDQNKIDQDYAIYDQQNKILPVRLRLAIQYVYNEAQYHQQMYDQVSQYVKQMEDDIYDYEQDLNIIREPIYTQLNLNQAPKVQVKNMIQISKIQNEDQQYATVPNFVWLTYYCALFFVFLSIIESFGRYAMCDLLVAVFVIKNFWMNYFDKIQIKINLIAIGMAIIYDIMYLYIFNQGVMSELHRKDLVNAESSTPGLFDFAVIMTWISLITKIIMVFLLKDINYEIANINSKGLYAFGIAKFQSEGTHQNPFILLDYQVQNKVLRQL